MAETIIGLFSKKFSYKVVECNFNSITDFKCIVRSDMNTSDNFKIWLNDFQETTRTAWNLRNSRSVDSLARLDLSKDFVCHHASARKRCKLQDGKDRKCSARLSVRIRKSTKFSRCRDKYIKAGFCTILKIDFSHTHRLDEVECLKWLKRTDNTKSAFIKYFNDGKSPSSAKQYHESLLVEESPDDLGNSQKNPPLSWVYQAHDKWLRKRIEHQSGDSLSEERPSKRFKTDEDLPNLEESKRPKQKRIYKTRATDSKPDSQSSSSSQSPIPKFLCVASGSETYVTPDLPEELSEPEDIEIKIKKEPEDSFSDTEGESNDIPLTTNGALFQPIGLVEEHPITVEEEPMLLEEKL